MGNTSDKEYNDRAEKLGLSTKKEISDILNKQQKDDAAQTPIVFVDVRSEAEVAAKSLQGNWDVKYVPCTRDDASPLQSQADSLLPDKNAYVILFCRSGARAVPAKKVLLDMGYLNVYNAGGLDDLGYIEEE